MSDDTVDTTCFRCPREGRYPMWFRGRRRFMCAWHRCYPHQKHPMPSPDA